MFYRAFLLSHLMLYRALFLPHLMLLPRVLVIAPHAFTARYSYRTSCFTVRYCYRTLCSASLYYYLARARALRFTARYSYRTLCFAVRFCYRALCSAFALLLPSTCPHLTLYRALLLSRLNALPRVIRAYLIAPSHFTARYFHRALCFAARSSYPPPGRTLRFYRALLLSHLALLPRAIVIAPRCFYRALLLSHLALLPRACYRA